MKLSVGYSLLDREHFMDAVLRYAGTIDEVYFSWGEMPNGRSPLSLQGTASPEQALDRLQADLQCLAEKGIQPNLLLNANCYGVKSLSAAFYDEIGKLLEGLKSAVGLGRVTTTSPMIAEFIKSNFKGMAVRASINMGVAGENSMRYLADCFDEFYLKREYNRNLSAIEQAHQWCWEHGKKLFMLANSGCLNDCPSHAFHDNLVAHEGELRGVEHVEFSATCWKYLAKPENRIALIRDTSWVRPEELELLEPYFDGAKIATRSTRNPHRVIAAYANRVWHGNILSLTEPSHATLAEPWVLDNDRIPQNFLATLLSCKKDCAHCGYCASVMQRAAINLETRSMTLC